MTILEINTKIQPQKQQLLQHPLYEKVKTIDDVFEIIDNQWSEYIKMRSDAMKYTKCGFDNYIWWNRELADWRECRRFEEYWENEDAWIKKYFAGWVVRGARAAGQQRDGLQRSQ